MTFKNWLLNKLVNYAISEGRKKNMQEVQKDLYNKESNSTMPGVSIIWSVNQDGKCTCPYHAETQIKGTKQTKRESKKRTVKKTVSKRVR